MCHSYLFDPNKKILKPRWFFFYFWGCTLNTWRTRLPPLPLDLQRTPQGLGRHPYRALLYESQGTELQYLFGLFSAGELMLLWDRIHVSSSNKYDVRISLLLTSFWLVSCTIHVTNSVFPSVVKVPNNSDKTVSQWGPNNFLYTVFLNDLYQTFSRCSE